jgi:Ca2+-binding EF-hand superfamily protein
MTPTSIGGSSALQQQLQAMFAKADLNTDGQLSSDEFLSIGQNLPQAGSSGRAPPMRGGGGGGENFSPATMSSLLAMQADRATEVFSNADADGDGALTADELSADMAAHAPAGADTSDRAADLVSRADSDGDGALSLDEFKAAAPPPPPPPGGSGGAPGSTEASTGKDDPLDTNGDGKVSMGELLASLQSADAKDSGLSTEASTLLARLIDRLTADTTEGAASTTAAAA